MSEPSGRWSRPSPETDGGERSPAAVDPAEHRRVLDELGSVVASVARPERARIESLITEAAAVALDLERERLLAKRRSRAALVRAESDTTAAREAQELSVREANLELAVAELRSLMARARGRFAASS